VERGEIETSEKAGGQKASHQLKSPSQPRRNKVAPTVET
jgi:hypothetical protein